MDTIHHLHTLYQHATQRTCPISMHLAEQGHPLRRCFLLVNAIFGSLHYCSNTAERLLAFGDDGREQVRMTRPQIQETAASMPSITHPEYSQWLRGFIAAGFPHSKARLGHDFFKLSITTARPDVLQRIQDAVMNTPYWQLQQCTSTQVELSLCRNPGGQLPSNKSIQSMFALIKTLFATYRLEHPSSSAPQPAMALANRPFLIGDVSQLSVTEHAVIAPQFPTGSAMKAQILAELQQLIRMGYPVMEKLQQYLAMLTAAQGVGAHLRTQNKYNKFVDMPTLL